MQLKNPRLTVFLKYLAIVCPKRRKCLSVINEKRKTITKGKIRKESSEMSCRYLKRIRIPLNLKEKLCAIIWANINGEIGCSFVAHHYN